MVGRETTGMRMRACMNLLRRSCLQLLRLLRLEAYRMLYLARQPRRCQRHLLKVHNRWSKH